MSEPTQAPTQAPRPSRMQQAVEHPAYPWLAWPIGLGLLALGGTLLYQERSADTIHQSFHAGTAAVGLLIIPGIAKIIANGIKTVGGPLLPLLPWGNRDGGAS